MVASENGTPIRLLASFLLPNGQLVDWFWRDVVLPISPHVGMYLQLKNDFETKIDVIAWHEEGDRLLAEVKCIDCRDSPLFTEEDIFKHGWKRWEE